MDNIKKLKEYLKEMTEIANKYDMIIAESIDTVEYTYDSTFGSKLYWDNKTKQYVFMTENGIVWSK